MFYYSISKIYPSLLSLFQIRKHAGDWVALGPLLQFFLINVTDLLPSHQFYGRKILQEIPGQEKFKNYDFVIFVSHEEV